MNKKQKFRNNFSSISEKECYEALSYSELFHLIILFQHEKRRYFKMFLDCLDRQVEEGNTNLDLPSLFRERHGYWLQHLHYEELVQWCFKETNRRTNKSGKN